MPNLMVALPNIRGTLWHSLPDAVQ